METNSRGLVPSKKHVQDREMDLESVRELVKFLDGRRGQPWDEAARDEYVRILVKHGMIKDPALP
jgi:hypothetical protein